MDPFHLIIITGMSGAGKSQAMKVLEDMGYFCIDNLPPVLIPKFAELCVKGGERVRHVALIADIRGGQFFDAMAQALQELEKQSVSYEILFMEASDKVLINRYKETRRIHPLAQHGRISQGIAEERERLAMLRNRADFIIDTSNLKTSQLRDMLRGDEPVGRKLDFLIQEINRECNTIGSKCSDLTITQDVVNMKAEVEKIREQVQNIE